MLLLSRLALGGVVAAAGPAVASLVGDLFPADERGRLYGFVLTGELVGAGFGIVVAGGLSGLLGWRLALGVIAIPAFVLAWAIRRWFPEPARGGQAQLAVGDTVIATADDLDAAAGNDGHPPAGTASTPHVASMVEEQAEQRGIDPAEGLVLGRHPHMSNWEAFRYVLRVPHQPRADRRLRSRLLLLARGGDLRRAVPARALRGGPVPGQHPVRAGRRRGGSGRARQRAHRRPAHRQGGHRRPLDRRRGGLRGHCGGVHPPAPWFPLPLRLAAHLGDRRRFSRRGQPAPSTPPAST